MLEKTGKCTGENIKIEDVLTAVGQPKQTVLNQYGTQFVDNRAVQQINNRSVHQNQFNVLHQDNPSVEQDILNLFHGGSSSSWSGSGGSGGGGGGGPRALRPIPEVDMAIEDG